MRKFRLDFKIDWKSKLLDLLIVIIGITIAFKLNNWNESRKVTNDERAYMSSFSNENRINRENLVAALDFSRSTEKDIDTLKTLLVSENYTDERIPIFIASMMALADFTPVTTTMENITASGEFDLITDINLRENLISAYNSFKTTTKFESMLANYVDKYLTPFLLENLRFSDFSSINSDFKKDPLFENIIIGYEALLHQQVNGYDANLKKLNVLNESLFNANPIDHR